MLKCVFSWPVNEVNATHLPIFLFGGLVSSNPQKGEGEDCSNKLKPAFLLLRIWYSRKDRKSSKFSVSGLGRLSTKGVVVNSGLSSVFH